MWQHEISAISMALVTTPLKVVTYFEEFQLMVYLHLQKTHGHLTKQSVELPCEVPKLQFM